MFQCWTQIDVNNFTETNFDSPEDAIQMTIDECISFARFRFYLDKDAVSRFRDSLLPTNPGPL